MKMNKRKIAIMTMFFLIIATVIGTSIVKADKKLKEKLVIEYYYYTPCASCTDGEDFKGKLEEKISEFITIDEYDFILNNTLKDDAYNKFMEVTENIEMPEGKVADLPMLKIEDNYIFGVEAIEKYAEETIRQAKNEKL
ncbi:hypothetical protein [Clostridium sp.]|uniref:hypothetical protein n=1 Tax=Clostridium sp. TaxID=1506 RepID=UPI003F3F3091